MDIVKGNRVNAPPTLRHWNFCSVGNSRQRRELGRLAVLATRDDRASGRPRSSSSRERSLVSCERRTLCLARSLPRQRRSNCSQMREPLTVSTPLTASPNSHGFFRESNPFRKSLMQVCWPLPQISLSFFPKSCMLLPSRLAARGVRVVTDVEVGCGGRGGGARRASSVADGEVAWSWRPDAGAKSHVGACASCEVTGARKPGPRGDRV
jgi:hypothetical protein